MWYFKLEKYLGNILTQTFYQILGRTHDASQFKSSVLYAKMLSCPDRWFPNNEYIVGDAAYPLLPNLMIPFKNTGRDRAKVRYNLVHSRTRQINGHSFGGLTSRWRFLWKHLYLLDLFRISKTIYTCCVLHNICVRKRDLTELSLHERFQEFDNENRNKDDVDVIVRKRNRWYPPYGSYYITSKKY